MRILLLSDIHANIQALESVLRDAGSIDAVWCAGDLTDYGISPHEVISFFRTNDIRCVSGNHDLHLLNILVSGEAEAFRGTQAYKWVHDNCDKVTQEDILYLKSLPKHLSLQADGISYLMQHQMNGEGDIYRMPESIGEFDAFWEKHHAGESSGEKRMIFGHTHRRTVHMLDNGKLWMNPGSVSYRRPDDTDKRAHYMIIDNGQILFRAVEYDREPSFRAAMNYVSTKTMLPTDLQDALFYFGNAKTSRDPLP